MLFFVGMFAASLVYFLIVDTFVAPDRRASKLNYQTFLLERIPGQRIIIDSGSNSLWAIRPEIIETSLKKPAFVIADWAGVPLEMKIQRLRKYAHNGDLIILPLEWAYYFKNEDPSDLVNRVFGLGKYDLIDNYAHYYINEDTVARYRFVLANSNLSHIRERYLRRVTDPPMYVQLMMKLSLMISAFENGIAGDEKNDLHRKRQPSMAGKSCREYLSARPLQDTALAEQAAALLAGLQEELEVKIILTWPAVAGHDCYDFSGGVNILTEQLRVIFGNAGILVVGTPENSLFSDAHVLDTYYHIDSAAAKERTERLIEDIKRANALGSDFFSSSADLRRFGCTRSRGGDSGDRQKNCKFPDAHSRG